jgi:hypothetical protein
MSNDTLAELAKRPLSDWQRQAFVRACRHLLGHDLSTENLDSPGMFRFWLQIASRNAMGAAILHDIAWPEKVIWLCGKQIGPELCACGGEYRWLRGEGHLSVDQCKWCGKENVRCPLCHAILRWNDGCVVNIARVIRDGEECSDCDGKGYWKDSGPYGYDLTKVPCDACNRSGFTVPPGQWDRMGILSDALEDGGCTQQAILDHLRSGDPHCDGCWAIRLILGEN